jgi:hypothetical protein
MEAAWSRCPSFSQGVQGCMHTTNREVRLIWSLLLALTFKYGRLTCRQVYVVPIRFNELSFAVSAFFVARGVK